MSKNYWIEDRCEFRPFRSFYSFSLSVPFPFDRAQEDDEKVYRFGLGKPDQEEQRLHVDLEQEDEEILTESSSQGDERR